MLVRSAGRRQQRRQTSQLLATSFAQLNLPWLAPAQLRWSASHAVLQSEIRPRRRRPDAPRPPQARAKGQVRRLATAADQYTPVQASLLPPMGYSSPGFKSTADKNIPWDFTARKARDDDDSDNARLSTLRPYDDPIIINSTTQHPAQLIKVQHGVQGTTSELLQYLHTSLRIGRFNRAEAIIQRLAEKSAPFAPELLHAHTAYLEEHLRVLASHPKGSSDCSHALKTMQKWFEVEVRGKGIQPDAKLLVVMARAAMRALEGKQRDRAVQRYADWAESLGPEVMEDMIYSEDFDDNEFTILGRVTSQFFQEEGQDGTEAAAPEKTAVEAQPAKQDEVPHYNVRHDMIPPDQIPEVMETEQKGTGLQGVKQAMKPFIDVPPLPSSAPIEAQRERAYERQRILEETSVDIALARWRQADEELRKIGINTAMQSKPFGALMWQWYSALLPALQQELKEVKKVLGTKDGRMPDERSHYGPFLECLPLEKVAANTILWVVSRLARGKDRASGNYEMDVKLNFLTTGLGKQLEAESLAEASQKRMKEDGKGGKKMRAGMTNSRQKNRRKKSPSSEGMAKITDAGEQLTWPLLPKVKLGAMLIQKLIEAAHLPVTREHPRTKEKITQMQPAFLHRIKYVLGKKIGVVAPNPALMEKLESEPLGSVIAKRMPMVVEPKPWTGWDKGGYLHYPNPILRLAPGDKSGKDYFLAAERKGDMGQLYAGLSALGKVPWKVHEGVFRVQLEAWNSGEAIANFAPLKPVFEAPAAPPAAEGEEGADSGRKREWLLALRDLENKRAGLHSKRCFQNFQLEIARAVVNETLYFPHNMDFRGRAYPIPPYLNHMGADNVRGLLVFAEGKRLGEKGLRWLKIHLATVAGYDKASLEERLRFTEDRMEEIYDSVRRPLEGGRWWLQAEDAWQTLAACFELTAALESGKPEEFVSFLPVQQDGTCNGLQHYAALGGDEIGARQVNLEPGDRPADVYTAVAEAVKEEVARDAKAGNPIARKLDGRITRKCVKQPVMTNVYGVTFFGAKEQVYRQLEVLFPEVKRFDAVNLNAMSHYVATKIFKALGSMFSGAQAIQHWLGRCADRIATCLTPEQIQQLTSPEEEGRAAALKPRSTRGVSKKDRVRAASAEAGRLLPGSSNSDIEMQKAAKPLFKSTVVWTTPLRLPVVQPYRKTRAREVKTNLQTIHLQEPQVWDPVSKRKQLQAFPPNFIHSLDATHMLLSALKCDEVGITFASIHDSFWTHACDVDRLSVLLRDAFVEMHSENIIGRLREEFMTRYKGGMYLASVVAKSEVGVKIAGLRREMRGKGTQVEGHTGELALEAERMRLVGSEVEEERRRGEAMVTPGSLVQGVRDDESAFAVPAEVSGMALGDLPEGVEFEATNSDADQLSDGADSSPAEWAESAEGVVGGSVLDKDTEALADEGSELGMEEEGEDGEEAGSKRGTKSTAAMGQTTRKKKAVKRYPRKTYVWLPMEFPEIPAKGGFDVTRLRASQYFFH